MAEEERLVELRTAITWRSEELEEKENSLEKREIALDKSRNETDNTDLHNSAEMNTKRKKDMESNDKV